MPAPSAPRHFSMIRGFHLADLFTLGNAACGVAGVLMAMRYLASRDCRDLLLAAAFAPAAFLFDVLDGRIARWRHTSSALGRELDSLADVISFGVAPAALAYACRPDRPVGRGHPRLLRLLRRLAPGALQRHRREPLGGQRQGRLLRRHADPDQRAADRADRLRRLAGPRRRRPSTAAPGACRAASCIRWRCCSRSRER